ncbi:MAG: ThuA domain-containing protein [Phycisphaerae bacterium]|nr:ThuA domain-containing protein [Phycisphaerae bacterium]
MKRRDFVKNSIITTGSIALMQGLTSQASAAAAKPKKNILIYTKNGKGYVHDNIPASIECLKKICADNGWTCEATDDASIFTKEKISKFDVLVFSNTNNETFDTEEQKKVFQEYIRNGGGFVGIHSACGSERSWPWFWANLGGKFVRHPPSQDFTIKIIDQKHPSTISLGAEWKWKNDECYYLNHLNPDIHVLIAVDLNTINDKGKEKYPGEIFGQYFPLAWCHEFDGGRQWYTALGHAIKHYKDENFVSHITGGIKWALTKNKTIKK